MPGFINGCELLFSQGQFPKVTKNKEYNSVNNVNIENKRISFIRQTKTVFAKKKCLKYQITNRHVATGNSVRVLGLSSHNFVK